MKVVLKVTVLDRILKEISHARATGHEVAHIIVSEAEHRELRADRRSGTYLLTGFAAYAAPHNAGAFETIELSVHKGKIGMRPFIRAVSNEFFNGYKLYVVPEDYAPVDSKDEPL